jgi:hypothetical protein
MTGGGYGAGVPSLELMNSEAVVVESDTIVGFETVTRDCEREYCGTLF